MFKICKRIEIKNVMAYNMMNSDGQDIERRKCGITKESKAQTGTNVKKDRKNVDPRKERQSLRLLRSLARLKDRREIWLEDIG